MSAQEPMPTDLAESHRTLWQDVAFLHLKWNIFSRLFGSAEAVSLLNSASAELFAIMQGIWADDVILGISRITDPPSTRRQENLSLGRLLLHVDRGSPPGLYDHLEGALSDLAVHCEPLRNRRNKLLAHPDLATKLKRTPVPLEPVTKRMVDRAFEMIREIMNQVERAYVGSTTMFEFADSLEADELIYALKDAREHRRQKRLRDGLPADPEAEHEA